MKNQKYCYFIQLFEQEFSQVVFFEGFHATIQAYYVEGQLRHCIYYLFSFKN